MPALPLLLSGRFRASTGKPSSFRAADAAFRLLCRGCALLVALLAALLVAILIRQSWLAIHTIGLDFLIGTVWDPEPEHRRFGALAFIYGTVATSAVAMAIAVPFGVGTAICLAEYAPGTIRRIGSSLVEMLAAVPSIVYGFWGLFVLVPFLQVVIRALGGPPHAGVGVLPAGIVLAIMIVPYIASIAYDVLRAVPRSQRDASLALGATRWRTIKSVVLPYARPGIIGGCFIALGRALGETMAVTMLIGNRPDIRFSLFAKGDSIASVIANQFTEATYDLYLSALVELGLVLMLVSVGMSALARLLIWQVSRGGGRFSLSVRKVKTAHLTGAADAASAIPGGGNGFSHSIPYRRALRANRLMTGTFWLSLILTVAPLFFILGYLLFEGLTSLNWNFFTQLPAPVGQTGGGMANACYGSLLLVGLATLFALPVGLFAAICLAEYNTPRFAAVIRFIGEMLGSVPSIVIGIFAYAVVVKPTGHFSGWAGGFALGVMMIPIFMRAAEGALKLVPVSIRQASDALGARRWQTILRIVLPAALPALITALFLSIARIAGETAPLLLTASSNQFWPNGPSDFMPSLPVYIFSYAVSPYEDWHRQAWAAALVLLAVIMLLNFGVRALSHRSELSTRQVE